METTTTTTAVPPLELTRAPAKPRPWTSGTFRRLPARKKECWPSWPWTRATYVGQCVTIGMTEDYFYLPAHKLLWRLFPGPL